MPKEEVGLIRKNLGRTAAQLFNVIHHMLPSVLFAEIDHGGPLYEGLPVAQMVIGHHHKAVAAQELGEGRVTSAVLRYAVGNLHHSHNVLPGGRPLVDMNQVFSIAGGKEIF